MFPVKKYLTKIIPITRRCFTKTRGAQALLTILTLLFAARNTAAAFDFKGIDVGGQKISAEQVQSTLEIKCGAGSEGRIICNGKTSIGGAVADANIVISPKSEVTRIALRISSRDFQKVVAAAIEKYGKPTREINSVLQNRMGAQFPNITYWWEGNGGNHIKISKYISSLDSGEVYFGTAEDTALLEQMFNKPKKGDI